MPRKRKNNEDLPAARCDYCGNDIPEGQGLKIIAPVRRGGRRTVHQLRFCNWREAFAFIMFLVSSEWDAAKAEALVRQDPSDTMYM